MELWPKDQVPYWNPAFGGDIPSLKPYLLKTDSPHGAVIICPGGGYGFRAPHEGDPVAEWLNSIGLSAFVLAYRCSPYRHPVPLTDARRAIRFVRCHSAQWNIDPNRIGILGFSAGGHLAACADVHYGEGNPMAEDPVERMNSRPDTMILCYPVLSFGEHRNHWTMVNLIGENPAEDLRHYYSLETQVGPHTPRTFLWHTAEDGAVPVQNSLDFASRLAAQHIPFSLHVYPFGGHGVGLAVDDPYLSRWTGACGDWLRGIGFVG